MSPKLQTQPALNHFFFFFFSITFEETDDKTGNKDFSGTFDNHGPFRDCALSKAAPFQLSSTGHNHKPLSLKLCSVYYPNLSFKKIYIFFQKVFSTQMRKEKGMSKKLYYESALLHIHEEFHFYLKGWLHSAGTHWAAKMWGGHYLGQWKYNYEWTWSLTSRTEIYQFPIVCHICTGLGISHTPSLKLMLQGRCYYHHFTDKQS